MRRGPFFYDPRQLPRVPVRSLKASYRQKLTCGCPVLDKLLRGGFTCGLITELTGEAAACKTQLCLQLLLNAQLPLAEGGLDGDSLYIYTEGNAPLHRLQQIAYARGWDRDSEVLERVMVKQGVHTAQDLLAALQQTHAMLQQPGPRRLRVLIIDSIAHVFRDVGDNPGVSHFTARAQLLFKVSALLRRMADKHHLSVIVTNQVTDAFEDGDLANKRAGSTAGLKLMTSGREVLPALGLVWSNCINQRLFLSRCPQPEGSSLMLRSARIVHSPNLPQAQCHYMVDEAGVHGLSATQAAALADEQQQQAQQYQQLQIKEQRRRQQKWAAEVQAVCDLWALAGDTDDWQPYTPPGVADASSTCRGHFVAQSGADQERTCVVPRS